MLIRKETTNLLQIFCEISLHSQVIFKSMKVADDIPRGTLECEWVKYTLVHIHSCISIGEIRSGIYTFKLLVVILYMSFYGLVVFFYFLGSGDPQFL